MTTDPRVLECAKAMALAAGHPESHGAFEINLNIATAGILKWLERGPSVAASKAALETGAVLDSGYNIDIGHMETLYRAMADQATKEVRNK